ncbi:MAG: bifunctional oligoribonuclease/PAP phosphatase NrnA [Candidatus Odinarchaeota archaeon]
MLKSKFEDLLAFLENKKIIISTHHLVDIDGLVSCFTLKIFLTYYLKNNEISIFFSELSKSAKNFLKNFSAKFPVFNLSYEKEFQGSKAEIILILDTNNLDQTKLNDDSDITLLKIPYIFIDHHYFGEKSENRNLNITSLNIIFKDYSSTAEIILQLFETYNTPLNNPLKILFISAILIDSGFFKHGNNNSIQNVGKLLSEDIKFQDIRALLKNDIDLSEKIAKIKGLQRLELIREGKYLIGITNVSSFGAAVASMLITIGFDVSIVISKETKFSRINTRARKKICEETGLNLAKILEQISKKYEGSGGGHDGAASLTIDNESDYNITELVENIKKYL